MHHFEILVKRKVAGFSIIWSLPAPVHLSLFTMKILFENRSIMADKPE